MSSATMAFAIFSAATSSSAFHYSAISSSSANPATASSRTSSSQLDATSSNNFSELDKLRAKRLNLRRPIIEEASAPIIHDDSQQQEQGLEYLYDQRQERHEDDFYHVILMPS